MSNLHPNHEDFVEKLATSREEALQKLGELNPYVMAPIPSSRFTGGPRWAKPGRAASQIQNALYSRFRGPPQNRLGDDMTDAELLAR